MPVPLQKFREIVLQLLYSYDVAHCGEEETSAFLSHELSMSKKVIADAQVRMLHIWQMRGTLDEMIQAVSEGYALERIQKIERSVLRIGLYELVYDEKIPPKVAISEAMRLARKYSTPEAASFVNALLDGVFKKQQGGGQEESLGDAL